MSNEDQITGSQIAAARALLGMSLDELANRSGIPVARLQSLEQSGEHRSDVSAVANVLSGAGIAFIDDNQTSAAGGQGVRLVKSAGQFDTDQSKTVQYKEHLAPDAPTGAGG